mgnify:CR=1 FL=1
MAPRLPLPSYIMYSKMKWISCTSFALRMKQSNTDRNNKKGKYNNRREIFFDLREIMNGRYFEKLKTKKSAWYLYLPENK